MIVYIHTKKGCRNYTFSRYRYAKEKLAYELSKKIKNLIIYRADLIKFNNNISINSNFFSKYVFIFFSKLNLIKTIEINFSSKYFYSSLLALYCATSIYMMKLSKIV